jgi:tape measure domain-containing protein
VPEGTEITLRFVADDTQATAALNRIKQKRDEFAREKTTSEIDFNDQAARAKLAGLRNEFARLQAERVGIRIEADTTQVQRSYQQIERETQILTAQTRLLKINVDTTQAEAATDSLMGKLQNIAAYSAGYQFFRLFENAVGAAGQAIVGFNSQLEQTRIAFTQMLGSAQSADAFLAQLQSFAQATPFQFGDLTKLSQQLMAMGIAANDVIPDLTAIGNAVAGVGGSTDVLQRVVMAFGQISSAGKANAQDLRQLTEAGIPAYQMLAKTLGTDVAGAMKQVTAGTVDAATAMDALTTGMNERFGGLMEAQSKTLLGRLSNLKDALSMEMADIGKPLFDQLSTGLDQIANYVQTANFKESFAAITEEVGQLLSAVEAVFALFSHIPAGVLEFGVRLAEIAVGVKAITAVSDAFAAGLTRSIAALRGETVAAEQDAAAQRQLAAAKEQVRLEGSVGAPIQSGVNAARGGLASGLAAVAPVAEVASMIAIPTFIGAGLADQVTKYLDDQEREAQQRAQQKQLHIFVEGALEWPGPEEAERRYAALQDRLNELDRTQERVVENLSTWGGGFGSFDSKVTAAIQANIDQTKAAKDQIDPEQLLANATAGLKKYEDQATAALKRTTTTADVDQTVKTSEAAIGSMQDEFIKAHGTLEDFQKLYREFTQDIEDQAEAQKKKIVQDQQQAEAMQKQADEIRQQASSTGLAPPVDIMAGLKGTSKSDADQIKLIADAFKLQQQELTKAQQEASQAQKQWLADTVAAATQAKQAISSIDLSKGFSGLAAAAPALEQARAAYEAIGQSSTALTNLTAIASEWKAVADATDAASESFNGYLNLFDETDQRIKMLSDLEKKWKDAQKAAEDAKKAGIATPEQEKLLQQAPTVLANINYERNQLQSNQAGDLTNMAQNMPDLREADKLMRSMADTAGGTRQIRVDVKTEVAQAKSDLDKWINEPREIKVKVTTDIAASNSFSPGAGVAGGVDLSGQTGYARPTTIRSTGGGPYGSGTLYQPGGGAQSDLGGGGGSTMTPHGDAAKIAQWKTYIDQAASQYHIDPYLLAAIIMHESSGTPGIVNPSGGASGLTQVYPPAHGNLDYNLLRGTSEQAIQYQIEQGAKILAGHIAAQGGNVQAGVANYGGYSASDPTYYKDLQSYLPGVTAALGSGAATPGTTPDQVVNTVGAQIVQKAMQSIGRTDLAEWCEQFVEETIQSILGRRGATGKNEGTAAQALVVAQQQGLEVPRAQAQPGDIVYYENAGDARGHAAIYMGGNQQIGTAADNRQDVHIGPVWDQDNPHFIRVPGVPGGGAGTAIGPSGAAVPPVGNVNLTDPNSPGAQAATAKALADFQTLQASITKATTAQLSYNEALKGIDARNLGAVQQEFTTLLPILTQVEQKKLAPDATDLQKTAALNDAYAETAQLTTAWAHGIEAINQGTGDLADAQKEIASIAAGPVADALNSQLSIMQEMKTTDDAIAAVEAQKADMAKQQQATSRSNQDEDRARQRSQTLDQRGQQDQDRARQRSQALEQRGIQDERDAVQRRWRDEDQLRQDSDRARQVLHANEMRRIQDESTAENDRWTTTSRQFEDAQRSLEHYGTAAKQQLVDEQRAREDLNRAATQTRNAQSQLAQAGARSAGTNAEAMASGQALAAIKDAQTTADDLFTQQTTDNKTLQDQQDRLASEALYNLETQRLAAQRLHEDTLSGIDKESTQSQRAFEDEGNRISQEDVLRQASHQAQMDLWAQEDKARQRSSEDEQFATETTRLAQSRANEDEQFALETTRLAQTRANEDQAAALDEQLKTLQATAAEEKGRLQTAQQALTAWQQAEKVVGQTADELASLVSKASASNSGTIPTKAGGGHVSGMAIVGDSPTGDMTNAEIVYGDFTVLSHADSVRRGYIPGNGLNTYVNGTGTAVGGGDVYHLNFNASGNATTDEQLFQRLTAWVAARDRQKEIDIRRTSMGARAASQGNARY